MINEWAARWGVPPEAIWELQQSLTVLVSPGVPGTPEGVAQQEIMMEAPRKGIRLWRNNNGACVDENGRHIRYGLANVSKKVNSKLKSSDLIGITPVHTDKGTLGVFTSIEVKRPGWKYTGTGREVAQLAWINLIVAFGGIAKFATSKEDL